MNEIPPGTNLFELPYQAPPYNVKSDFNKRSDLLTFFLVIIIIMILINTTFLVLRIRARLSRDERWKLDDWVAILAWCSTNGLGLLLTISVQKLGRSTWDISLGFLITAWPQRVLVSMAFAVALSLLLGKFCLLALLYQIFGHIDRVRHQIYWTGVLSFPLLAACIVSPVLASPPLGKSWGTQNPHNKEGSIVVMAIGVTNLIVDLLILYMPIPSITTLNLSQKRKMGVLAIFLTGSIAIVADAIVMYYRVRLYQAIDPLRDGMIVGLCSFIEASISIICSSMPSAAKVWRVHIAGSDFYVSLVSRFGSTRSNLDRNASDDANPPRIEQPPKKKRRGLYSIGTLPTTTFSTTRLNKSVDVVELETHPGRESGRQSNGSIPLEVEVGQLNDNTEGSKGFYRAPLAFNDPSNFMAK